MGKFKAGDRIKLINVSRPTRMSAKLGATAVVQDPPYRHQYLCVKWDRNELSGGQCDGGYLDESFELISEGVRPTIRARDYFMPGDLVKIDPKRKGYADRFRGKVYTVEQVGHSNSGQWWDTLNLKCTKDGLTAVFAKDMVRCDEKGNIIEDNPMGEGDEHEQ